MLVRVSDSVCCADKVADPVLPCGLLVCWYVCLIPCVVLIKLLTPFYLVAFAGCSDQAAPLLPAVHPVHAAHQADEGRGEASQEAPQQERQDRRREQTSPEDQPHHAHAGGRSGPLCRH